MKGGGEAGQYPTFHGDHEKRPSPTTPHLVPAHLDSARSSHRSIPNRSASQRLQPLAGPGEGGSPGCPALCRLQSAESDPDVTPGAQLLACSECRLGCSFTCISVVGQLARMSSGAMAEWSVRIVALPFCSENYYIRTGKSFLENLVGKNYRSICIYTVLQMLLKLLLLFFFVAAPDLNFTYIFV